MNYTLKLAQARSRNRHDVGHDVEKSKRVKTLRLRLILDSLRLELHPGGHSAGLVMLTVGIRVAEETRNVPDSTELARLLAESVSGTRPEGVRAMRAVNRGSSDLALNGFVHQLKEAANSRSLGPAARKESPYS
ncbi:hypothetical protein AAG906_001573 [Vitis piasezkii]